MKKTLFFLFALVIWAGSANVQAQTSTDQAKTTAAAKPKRGPVFRPTKDQIMEVQQMLVSRQLYSGEPSGKYDDPTRAGIKSFQKANGLRETGTLNRATLEKFGVELTESQKAIPVDPKSFAPADDGKPKKEMAEKSGDKPKKAAPFRATAEQLTALQRVLKSENLFAGEANGKRSDDFKAAVKKYQSAKGLNATGGVNADTLKAAGVELTDKQKEQN